MRVFLLLLSLLGLVAGGCSPPGGGAGTLPQAPLPSPSGTVPVPSPAQPRGTGTVSLLFTEGTLAGVAPPQQRFRLTAFDSRGRAIYGPLERNRSEPIVLTDVPVNAASLGISLLGGDLQVAVGQAPLSLAATGFQTLRDPALLPLSALLRLQLEPPAVRLAKDTATQVSALGVFNGGQQILMSAAVTWESLNPGPVPVSVTGQVEGLDKGTVILFARSGAVQNQVTVVVTDALLQAIRVAPANVSIASLTNTTLTAEGFFSDGTIQDLTNLVQWSTSRPEVVSVSPTGLVVGLSGGLSVVNASGGSFAGTANVTVAP